MHAWGRETGGASYDLKLACQDIRQAFAKVIAITPDSAEAVLILGGDTLMLTMTTRKPRSQKHKLDVDGGTSRC